MKSRYLLIFAFLFLLAGTPLDALAQTFFTARLTADQAGVAVDGQPVGTAALVLTEEGLRYHVSVDGLSGVIAAAHFHDAPIGESSGVVHTITFEGNEASGLWPASGDGAMSAEMRTALLTGGLYINVHTEANPGGEIRGQVLPTSGTSLTASLTPDQETGDVTSSGSGTAAVQLTDAGAIYYVTVDGLTGPVGAAHFHYSPVGVSGGVVRGITFDGNTSFGVWTESDDQPLVDSLVTHLLLGHLYLNVHTEAYGAGEIRGQVYPNGGIGFEAILNPENQSGEVTSDGLGTGAFTLTDAGLVYHITVSQLTGPIGAAHFHQAPAGADGNVVRAIAFDGNTAMGIWRPEDGQALTDELIQDLLEGGLYVNVHTADYGGGEIRGQVELVEGTHLWATLTPEAEQAGVESDGVGSATMELTDEGLEYSVTVDALTGSVSAAHFHTGAIGVGGGVVHGITFDGTTAAGVWAAGDMPDSLLVALLTGGLYLNVHTEAYPSGEIRGQVLLSNGAGLLAFLTNEQEPGEVTQEGSGTASMTLTNHGLVYRATATGLSGDIAAAHFHDAPAGANSGVVHGVTFDGGTTSGVWRASDSQALTDSLEVALLTGGIYLNVHTATNPGGEIRGQVELAGGIGRAVEMDPESEGAAANVESEGHGTASVSLTGSGLVFHATVSELTGPIGAAHFHRAPLGESGGVLRGVTFDGANLAGVWRASDGEALDVSAMQAFFGDELYLNVHTEQYGGGEIRGQVDLAPNQTGTAAERDGSGIPESFGLGQNYPNPFNPSTTITMDLARSADARLEVFDALGRRVAVLHDGPLTGGRYTVTFDGSGLASGLYVYRLSAGNEQVMKTMILMK